MNRRIAWFTSIPIAIALGAFAIVRFAPAETKEAQLQVPPGIVEAGNTFGIYLFHRLGEEGKWSRNVFISPSSIALALSMTLNGACGEVREAIAKTLRVDKLSPEEIDSANAALLMSLEKPGAGVSMSIANSLWAREGVDFEPDFMRRNRESYRAEIASLDFSAPEAKDTINAWIAGKTQDRIKHVLDRIDPAAIMLLVNAVYFKGEWTEKFPAARTHDDEFILPDGSRKKVPMMNRRGSFGYLSGEGFQAVRLPYGEGRIAMYIFLPAEDSSLTAMAARLTPSFFKQQAAAFRPVEGSVAMPRFKIEYTANLNEPLKELGMGPAFVPSDTDWKPMTPADQVFVNRVLHKSYVEVNEEGTEAAASTVVEIGLRAAPVDDVRVVVNRPFLAAIRDDRTEAILFIGAIADP